ncbi:hypothetical protein V6N13_056923 [Hibiscus sabdariffa]
MSLRQSAMQGIQEFASSRWRGGPHPSNAGDPFHEGQGSGSSWPPRGGVWQELATSRWRGGPQAVHAEPRILQVALLPRGHQLKPASYVRRAVPHSRPPRSGEVPLVL